MQPPHNPSLHPRQQLLFLHPRPHTETVSVLLSLQLHTVFLSLIFPLFSLCAHFAHFHFQSSVHDRLSCCSQQILLFLNFHRLLCALRPIYPAVPARIDLFRLDHHPTRSHTGVRLRTGSRSRQDQKIRTAASRSECRRGKPTLQASDSRNALSPSKDPADTLFPVQIHTPAPVAPGCAQQSGETESSTSRFAVQPSQTPHCSSFFRLCTRKNKQ